MALSAQDLVTFALLGKTGNLINIGCGNLSGEPAADFFWWLGDIGWKCVLGLDIRADLIEEAKRFHPTANVVCADALTVNFRELYKRFNVPKVVDVLSVDVDPCSIDVLRRLPFDNYEYKLIFVEHDLYVQHRGPRDKFLLQQFMKDKTDYHLFAEDMGLVFCTPNYLEDWYVNKKYVNDFKVKDILERRYYRINPNTVALDLLGIKV